MGEATKNLSQTFKELHPDLPWKEMAATRNKVIHEYFGVNLELIWDVVENRLPQLKEMIDRLLVS